ncbi:hypothetical protein [Pseudomonas brassicacearum]|uniref:hypothetical protein n=1 Tax=Pseudomonas brassicacearum TaxID=930166 RepID=UPI000F48FDB5|nr:hypothetical protein [Pseudomonas brassicacearum]
MDWKQFCAAIIGSLAWPTAVVVVVVLLRSPLAKLIPMVRSLKYKDLHIDLSEKLEAVKEVVEAGTQNAEQPTPLHAEGRLLELARIDPRAAVMSAWIDVERALNSLAKSAGISTNAGPMTIASELHAKDVLTALEMQTFRDLRRIRNDAGHLRADVHFDEAKSMAEMCGWLAHRLRMVEQSYLAAVPSTNASAST